MAKLSHRLSLHGELEKAEIGKRGCVPRHFGACSILVIFDAHVLLSTPLATRKVCQTSCHFGG